MVLAISLGVAGTQFVRSNAPQLQLPPPLINFEKLGNLVALKVNYANVFVTSKERGELSVPLTGKHVSYGGARVILIARGDCTLATDLRNATYESIDQVNKTVTVVLQSPTVLEARIRHDAPESGGSTLFSVSNQGLEWILPGDGRTAAIDDAFNKAQRNIESLADNPETIRAARENAEHVVAAWMNGLGWKGNIKWK